MVESAAQGAGQDAATGPYGFFFGSLEWKPFSETGWDLAARRLRIDGRGQSPESQNVEVGPFRGGTVEPHRDEANCFQALLAVAVVYKLYSVDEKQVFARGIRFKNRSRRFLVPDQVPHGGACQTGGRGRAGLSSLRGEGAFPRFRASSALRRGMSRLQLAGTSPSSLPCD